MRTPLTVAPLSDHVWDQYRWCFGTRSLQPPPRPDAGLFVLHGDRFVAGLSLYGTTGPFVIAEYLVTNPWVPLRVRHDAIRVLLEQSTVYATVNGKNLFWVLRSGHRGLARTLWRFGAIPADGSPWTVGPCVEIARTPPRWAEKVSHVERERREEGNEAQKHHPDGPGDPGDGSLLADHQKTTSRKPPVRRSVPARQDNGGSGSGVKPKRGGWPTRRSEAK